MAQVSDCCFGLNANRQRSSVRRDYTGRPHTRLQTKILHAKGHILVIRIDIEHKILGFRNTPGDVKFITVHYLALDSGPVAALNQGAAGSAHNQVWHQVFEHGAAPGNQRGDALYKGERTAK